MSSFVEINVFCGTEVHVLLENSLEERWMKFCWSFFCWICCAESFTSCFAFLWMWIIWKIIAYCDWYCCNRRRWIPSITDFAEECCVEKYWFLSPDLWRDSATSRVYVVLISLYVCHSVWLIDVLIAVFWLDNLIDYWGYICRLLRVIFRDFRHFDLIVALLSLHNCVFWLL